MTRGTLAAAALMIVLWMSAGSERVVAVSPPADDTGARVADSPPGRDGPLVGRLAGAGGTTASYSGDGRFVLTAGGRAARVWDAATLRPMTPPLRHDGPILTAVFSADASRVVTASDDGTARVWEVATGRPAAPPLRQDPYPSFAIFSPDGTTVVTGGNRAAVLWDARTGRRVQELPHPGLVYTAAFSPDGRTLLTTTASNLERTARVWNLGTGKVSVGPLARVTGAAVSPDGRRIATVEDRAVRIRDAATGRPVSREMDHDGLVNGVAFSPDGSRLVTVGEGFGRVWDAATGEAVTRPLAGQGAHQMHVGAFSPDGRRVLVAGEGATSEVWEVDTGRRLMVMSGEFDAVIAAAWSPDGGRVVVGCYINNPQADREGDTEIWPVQHASK